MNARKVILSKCTGFTVIELLIVVAAIGLLAQVAMTMVGPAGERVAVQKLKSDVATVNSAVSHYLTFGGKLDNLTDPAEVLRKLQSEASPESAKVLPGLAGSFLDRRVEAVFQTEAQAEVPGAVRAVWHSAKKRFEIVESGRPGIREFRLGEERDATFEERKGTMDYARKSGWVWDYKDRPVRGRPTVFAAATGDRPAEFSRVEPFSSPVGTPAKELEPPRISIPTGDYPIADFDLRVSFADPNPSGVGRIVYRIGSGTWEDYIGGTVAAAPDSELFARVLPLNSEKWTMSGVSEAVYGVVPEPLIAPRIAVSTPFFAPGGDSISVTLENLNAPGRSQLTYRVNRGAWMTYTGSFDLERVGEPGETTVEAYACTLSPYYLDSPIASQPIGESQSELQSPLITFDRGYFDRDHGVITVSMANPNPVGSSQIRFQLVPLPSPSGGIGPTTDFVTYTGPFTVSAALYPEGFGVKTFAEAVQSGYTDSPTASRFATDHGGLFGGHLDLDTSTFIADIGNGSTSAHTHDITGKFDLTTIDLFAIPDSKQVEIDEAITDPATRFKLTVVNGDLSPGLTLAVTYTKDGITRRVEQPVDRYGNIALGDLETFTLGGIAGTAKLESLALKMDQDLIYQAAVIPTNTGDVRGNQLGKSGEWRNGALTVQAVTVNPDGRDGFTSNIDLSQGGVHGAATAGLLWEAAVFWHWGGDSYHEEKNHYRPMDFSTIADEVD